MDLRHYYQKMRGIEADIEGPHVIVVSLETPDAGKAGVRTEVTRETAARMILEGRATLDGNIENAPPKDPVGRRPLRKE